jgi:energy-converting hydrogenase Eha subunit F
MATPDTASTAVIDVVGKTGQAASVLTHIVERRLEYLLGTLIAHQLGLLDQVLTYGTGLC